MSEQVAYQPQWLDLAQKLYPVFLQDAEAILMMVARSEQDPRATPNLRGASLLALYHFARCLETSIRSNNANNYSVAIALVRQCVEALSVIEVGLLKDPIGGTLLADWQSGRVSVGELRKRLETTVWPSCGCGLWDEPWGEFFGNFARAVQPYAHCTPELLTWQVVFPSPLIGAKPADFGASGVVSSGGVQEVDLAQRKIDMGWAVLSSGGVEDPIKRLRVFLLQSLLVWTLGRFLLRLNPTPDGVWTELEELGKRLGSSRLLMGRGNWGVELFAHTMYFEPDGWRDE